MSGDPGRVVVRGAREHNLKNIDLAFARERLVVITGPSGAGKSSLAFDTLYAEGQRRYVEALSMRARQHLERLPRADVDLIEGLPPAIGVRGSDAQASTRATVGTTTELHELLGLLYARVGQQHCPRCSTRIEPLATAQMVDRVLALAEGTRVSVRAPLLRDDEADLPALLQGLRKDGYARAVLDGRMIDLGAGDLATSLPKRGKHSLDVDVDRIAIKPGVRARLADSIELALRAGKGAVRIAVEGGESFELSTGSKCLQCGLELAALTPESFSFQSPRGACEACGGLGERRQFQPELVVPEPELSLRAGAIAAWGTPDGRYYARMLAVLLDAVALDADVAFSKLPARTRDRVLHGGKGYEGVLPGLERRLATLEQKAQDDELDWLEQELGQFMERDACERCHGSRLNARALAVKITERNLGELLALQLDALLAFCAGLQWPAAASVIEPIMAQVRARLSVIIDLGLGYLSLGRSSRSLSRGEAERIRLASHLGGGLCGVLYVLDEPTTGLHPRDTTRLLRTLKALRDRGNSVLVVEHDLEVIGAADHVIELGPGAGALGGRLLASCAPVELQHAPQSVTAAYLARDKVAAPVRASRPAGERRIELRSARTHNLHGVDADFPIGRMTCVTGVSGSGKTSLVMHTLLPAARAVLRREAPTVAATISGLQGFGRVVHVDQAPIGRSPRSIPATYAGLFGPIRALFSELPEARARGYGAERFSFNVKGGRCERCQGAGQVRVDMQFLPDAYVLCEVCSGARFDRETLEVRYRGRSIADVLAGTVDDASELFGQVPKLAATLAALRAVGLGYLSLGQSATALSSGEAQRLRLARELARRGGPETLYLLDEPSAGLHPSEVELLARVLEGLTEEGHTVILVEHHLDLALASDWVIDLGPEGGEAGGRVLAAGTATDVARCPASHTGHYLARRLGITTG